MRLAHRQVKPKSACLSALNRLKAMKENDLSLAKAKGYGLWLAKVVAAQKFGRLPKVEKGKGKEGKEKGKEKKKKREQKIKKTEHKKPAQPQETPVKPAEN